MPFVILSKAKYLIFRDFEIFFANNVKSICLYVNYALHLRCVRTQRDCLT